MHTASMTLVSEMVHSPPSVPILSIKDGTMQFVAYSTSKPSTYLKTCLSLTHLRSYPIENGGTRFQPLTPQLSGEPDCWHMEHQRPKCRKRKRNRLEPFCSNTLTPQEDTMKSHYKTYRQMSTRTRQEPRSAAITRLDRSQHPQLRRAFGLMEAFQLTCHSSSVYL